MKLILAIAAVATAFFAVSCSTTGEDVDNNVGSGVWRIAPGTP